jgi:transcriptional regulator with XRE-family HTH domain
MTRIGGWPDTGFGPRLRELREKAGMTQEQLGELANCAKNTVARLERGEQEPAWPLVLAFAKALGVDCTTFTEPATFQDKPKPGRPAKAKPKATEAKRNRPRGRPKKVE